MSFDDIDISQLPANPQDAFVEFERAVREKYEKLAFEDSQNLDQNGNYIGSYDIERAYVTELLAFLDEYDLEVSIEDISALNDSDFQLAFQNFRNRIQYTTARYRHHNNRISSGGIGTPMQITQCYKAEIASHLDKIRKIVNLKVEAGQKKDKIFSKISSLQSEVDRDQTTVDAVFARVLGLSRLIGDAGENIKPAIDQFERVKRLIFDASEPVEKLPSPDRPKLIPKDENSQELPDDIPF